MDARGIETFLVIASCHSLSAAADILHITQSAVSRRIRDLEGQLGMVLVDRQRGLRQCELTRAGEAFYPLAERWSQLWRETQLIKSSFSLLALTIGCVDSASTYVLPRFYKALVAHEPPVHLRIFGMRSIEMYAKVERRELDVAFVHQELRHQHIKVAPFFSEPMLVLRPRQEAPISSMARIMDLNPLYELFVNWGPAHQIWRDRNWDPLHTPQIELDMVTLIHNLMEDRRHWAMVPSSVADYFLKHNSRLIAQRIDPPPPNRVLFMITHRFPRLGARQAIEILESVARNLGFLNT